MFPDHCFKLPDDWQHETLSCKNLIFIYSGFIYYIIAPFSIKSRGALLLYHILLPWCMTYMYVYIVEAEDFLRITYS